MSRMFYSCHHHVCLWLCVDCKALLLVAHCRNMLLRRYASWRSAHSSLPCRNATRHITTQTTPLRLANSDDEEHKRRLESQRTLKFLGAQRRHIEHVFRNNFAPFCGVATPPDRGSAYIIPFPVVSVQRVSGTTFRWSASCRWAVTPTLTVSFQGTYAVEDIISTTPEDAKLRMLCATMLLLPNPKAVTRFLEVLRYRDVVALDAAHRAVGAPWEICIGSEPMRAPVPAVNHGTLQSSSTAAPESANASVNAPRVASNRRQWDVKSSTASKPLPPLASVSSMGCRATFTTSLLGVLSDECSDARADMIYSSTSQPSSSIVASNESGHDDANTATVVLCTKAVSLADSSLCTLVRDATKEAWAMLSETAPEMIIQIGMTRQRELTTLTSVTGTRGAWHTPLTLTAASSGALDDASNVRSHLCYAVPCDGESRAVRHFADPTSHSLQHYLQCTLGDIVTGLTEEDTHRGGPSLHVASLNVPTLTTCDVVFIESLRGEDETVDDVPSAGGVASRWMQLPRFNASASVSLSTLTTYPRMLRSRRRGAVVKVDQPLLTVREYLKHIQNKHRSIGGDDFTCVLPSIATTGGDHATTTEDASRSWNNYHVLEALASADAAALAESGARGSSSTSPGTHRACNVLPTILARHRLSIEEKQHSTNAPAATMLRSHVVRARLPELAPSLLGCAMEPFMDEPFRGGGGQQQLRRGFAGLLGASLVVSLVTEFLRVGGRLLPQSIYPPVFPPNDVLPCAPSLTTDSEIPSANPEAMTPATKDISSTSSSRHYAAQDRSGDVADVLMMFQTIREILGQPTEVVPTLTIHQEARYNVAPHLLELASSSTSQAAHCDIPVSTTCTIEWPLVVQGVSATSDEAGTSWTTQALRISRSSDTMALDERNGDWHFNSAAASSIAPGSGVLPLIIECVSALYRLLVVLTGHRSTVRHAAAYERREERRALDALIATAQDFLNSQLLWRNHHNKGAGAGADVDDALRRYAPLEDAIDPSTTTIPVPTVVVHDVTRRQGFLDFVMFSWFGAAPQEKFFHIRKHQIPVRSGNGDYDVDAETGVLHGTADGVGPVVEVEGRAAELTMTRAQLFYDVLGNRVLVAAVHAKTPLDAQRALLDQAVLLNLPRLDARKQHNNGKKKSATGDDGPSAAGRGVDGSAPTSSGLKQRRWDRDSSTTSLGLHSHLHLQQATQKYSIDASNGALSSPIRHYLHVLADAGYKARIAGSATTSAGRSGLLLPAALFVVYRCTGNAAKDDQLLADIRQQCASNALTLSAGGAPSSSLSPACIATCLLDPYNVTTATAGTTGPQSSWLRDIESGCRDAVYAILPNAAKVVSEAENQTPCLARDGFPMFYDPTFYTPTNLLAEALQGLCQRYEAHYEPCHVSPPPPPSSTDRSNTHTTSSSRIGFRCTLSIASVGGLDIPQGGGRGANAVALPSTFVLGVGVGDDRLVAWKAAATAALAAHFPQLVDQVKALAALRSAMAATPPSVTMATGIVGCSTGLFSFATRNSERVCHLRRSSVIASTAPAPVCEGTGPTDGEALSKALQAAEARLRTATTSAPQIGEDGTTTPRQSFLDWDVTSNYQKSSMHALLGALGVLYRGKLRVTHGGGEQQGGNRPVILNGNHGDLMSDIIVTVEMMDDNNHLRVAVVYPPPLPLSDVDHAFFTSVARRRTRTEEAGGALLISLFQFLRHRVVSRCHEHHLEELTMLSHMHCEQRATEGSSFRLSAERRLSCLLRSLLGLQVEVVVVDAASSLGGGSVGGADGQRFKATVFVSMTVAGASELAALQWQGQLTAATTRHVATSKRRAGGAAVVSPVMPPRKFPNIQGRDRTRFAILSASSAVSRRAAIEVLLVAAEQFVDDCLGS